MDTAGALPDGHPDDPGVAAGPVVDPPAAIGVPSIPPATGRSPAPASVPSIPAAPPAPVAPPGVAQVLPPPVPLPELRPPVVRHEGGGPGFPPGVADQLRAYVYLLVDPRTETVLYVGRGRGDRCYRHVGAARAAAVGQTGPGGAKRHKFPVLDQVREIEASGREVRIDILRYGLKGSEASLVARATGEALGLPTGAGPTGRRLEVSAVAALLAEPARFKRSHQVVLLRVGDRGADVSYEVARHNWRIGRRWADVGSPRAPKWAAVVAGELVAGVYRIDRWEPTPVADWSPPDRPSGRYSFVGEPAPDLEDRYRHRNVAAYLGAGPPGQVTYVWSGPHWVDPAR